MQLLLVLTLATLALAGQDYDMIKKWQKLKAMESCWGEDNMKLYTVEVKKAIAKCHQEDAPELSLPPYRSSYRVVNTLLNKADEMDNMNNMQSMFAKMMSGMMKQNQPSFSTYSQKQMSGNTDDMMEKMRMMMMMKKMKEMMSSSSMSYQQRDNSNFDMSDMMETFGSMFDGQTDKMDNFRSQNYRKSDPMARMSEMFSKFSRSKRAVGQNLDLGDRLVEKLADQKMKMEAKVGNMTCVLRQMNCLDSSNNIDITAMKQDMQQYTLPSPWFGEKYAKILDVCYEMATNLPAEIADNSVVTGTNFGTVKLGEVKAFMMCCNKAKSKLCMHQDIKQKVETNFGPMEDILKETQLTEHEFFPLVIQLLHGQEMDYIMGGF